jgi:hypothetical protein
VCKLIKKIKFYKNLLYNFLEGSCYLSSLYGKCFSEKYLFIEPAEIPTAGHKIPGSALDRYLHKDLEDMLTAINQI